MFLEWKSRYLIATPRTSRRVLCAHDKSPKKVVFFHGHLVTNEQNEYMRVISVPSRSVFRLLHTRTRKTKSKYT